MDLSPYTIPVVIGAIASIPNLVLTNRLLKLKAQFTAQIIKIKTEISAEMTQVITNNCAGKAEFHAHADADKVFQETLTESIMEKREEYMRAHARHDAHAANTGIHQQAMSAETVNAKLDTINVSIRDLSSRTARLETAVERQR